ncbi:MAG: hypothetical protein NWE98_03955 [Candidatus Bathyarchaeota archaeon]|nr:hypothetical protein [Candidatus Bathyarchaeota archaeon]
MRGTHTFVSLLARFMSKFRMFKGTNNTYYQINIPSNIRRAWQIMEFFSVIPVILFKFILPSFLNYCVIAERYVPDFIVWIAITTRDKSYLEKIEARFLIMLSMKAHIKIYLTAALEELLKRRKENSVSLGTQIELYDQLALTLQACKIDTTEMDVTESMQKILSHKLRILRLSP